MESSHPVRAEPTCPGRTVSAQRDSSHLRPVSGNHWGTEPEQRAPRSPIFCPGSPSESTHRWSSRSLAVACERRTADMHTGHPPSAQLITVGLLPGGVQSQPCPHCDTQRLMGDPNDRPGPRAANCQLCTPAYWQCLCCAISNGRRLTLQRSRVGTSAVSSPRGELGTHNVEQCLSVGPEQTRTWLHY